MAVLGVVLMIFHVIQLMLELILRSIEIMVINNRMRMEFNLNYNKNPFREIREEERELLRNCR